MTEIDLYDDAFEGFDEAIAEIENSAEYAEEGLVADAQSLLVRAMEEKNISKADLARLLDVSRARVTQMLSTECQNLTLRLLARAAFRLDVPIKIVRADEVRARKHANGEWCLGANPFDSSVWHKPKAANTEPGFAEDRLPAFEQALLHRDAA